MASLMEKDDKPSTMTEPAPEANAEPVKKGRGRPRKVHTGTTPEPEKRPRGRPRKIVDPAELAAKAATPKRGRGRPRKEVDAAEENATPKAGRGRPRKEVDPAEQNATPKTGRGRPRKEPSEKADANGDTQPRKRGRPRKSEVSEAAGSPLTKQNANAKTKQGMVFPLKSIVGTYSIECDMVAQEWPDAAEDMRMVITQTSETSDGLIAGFHLGVIEGTMLLASDKASLEELCAKMGDGARAHTKHVRKESSDPDNGSEEEDGDDDDDDDEEEDAPPAKKAKTQSSTAASQRIFFRWRGRETSEGEIYTGNNGGNNGYLFFKKGSPGNFKGVAGFPAVGEKCEFKGTRIDHEPAEQPEPWSNFSEEAREDANRSRWK